ncbi:MAG: GTP-binding protein [Lachnospiraceae bacterium]
MTKIDIVSGFLGAGKTTLIKKMIDEVFQGEKIVLIENEFGEVGIDGGFLKDAGIEISEMNSGCICCSLVGDFGKNLKEVLTKFHPDRILVEPSGVGKLSDVMKSVLEVSQEAEVTLNALVTVVNAKKALKQMKAFGEFFNNQVENASTIVLSRTQDLEEQKLEECVLALQEKNPNASIITTPWENITGTAILAAIEKEHSLIDSIKMEVGESAHGCCGHHHDHEEEHEHGCCGHHDHEEEHEHSCCGHHDHDHHHHADEVFVSWGIETPHKFEKSVIEKALDTLCNSEKYESTILRAKGMVPCVDGSWIYFDLVPGDYELRTGEADYTGRLVVIGTNVCEDTMKELFGLE